MARKLTRKPQAEVGWQAFQMRGSAMKSLGVVYAANEIEAIKKAVDQFGVPIELQTRIVVRPWE